MSTFFIRKFYLHLFYTHSAVCVCISVKEYWQKDALKMLMKTRPVVNFINILCAAFVPISYQQKSQSQTINREKLRISIKIIIMLRRLIICLGSIQARLKARTVSSSENFRLDPATRGISLLLSHLNKFTLLNYLM